MSATPAIKAIAFSLVRHSEQAKAAVVCKTAGSLGVAYQPMASAGGPPGLAPIRTVELSSFRPTRLTSD
jgi:hypothetical protein